MADDLILVFDVGKTNAKLAAFSADDLAVVETRSTPNAPRVGALYDEVDSEALWTFLIEGLAAFSALGRITDIVPTTHACAAALVDADGLVLPIMDYEWAGLDAWRDRYAPHRPPFAETGSPELPIGLNLGRQLFALQSMAPQEFARASAILPYPQYWAWGLCGQRDDALASDVSSLGCHSDLWAPHAGTFSSLATAQGWDRRFGPVRPAAAVVGQLDTALAESLGIADRPRIRAGLHDSNAALLPFLSEESAAFSFVSSGTWAIAFAIGTQAVALDEARDGLLNVDFAGRPVPSGRTMAGREFALLTQNAAGGATLEDALRVMQAGSMVTPAVVPGVGPHPKRVSKTLGPPPASPADRRAIASLYTGLMLRDVLELLGAAGPIILDGALGRDPIVGAFLTAATGRSVRATEANTSFGAAMLGLERTVAASISAIPRPSSEFQDSAARYAAAWRSAL